jgi:uncharacterized membrane protein
MSEPKSRRIPKPFWFAIPAVLMLVLAVFLAVWLPYQREQVAVLEIERLGWTTSTRWDGPEWMRSGPGWIQEIIEFGWLSWFNRVYRVRLPETATSNQGLKHLSDLSNLESLYLDNARVSDDGLKYLSNLSNLHNLSLTNTQVSDEGLKHLTGLTELECLYIENTQISDEGLKHLIGLTNLISLYLDNTQVTEEGIKELQYEIQKEVPHFRISY